MGGCSSASAITPPKENSSERRRSHQHRGQRNYEVLPDDQLGSSTGLGAAAAAEAAALFPPEPHPHHDGVPVADTNDNVGDNTLAGHTAPPSPPALEEAEGESGKSSSGTASSAVVTHQRGDVDRVEENAAPVSSHIGAAAAGNDGGSSYCSSNNNNKHPVASSSVATEAGASSSSRSVDSDPTELPHCVADDGDEDDHDAVAEADARAPPPPSALTEEQLRAHRKEALREFRRSRRHKHQHEQHQQQQGHPTLIHSNTATPTSSAAAASTVAKSVASPAAVEASCSSPASDSSSQQHQNFSLCDSEQLGTDSDRCSTLGGRSPLHPQLAKEGTTFNSTSRINKKHRAQRGARGPNRSSCGSADESDEKKSDNNSSNNNKTPPLSRTNSGNALTSQGRLGVAAAQNRRGDEDLEQDPAASPSWSDTASSYGERSSGSTVNFGGSQQSTSNSLKLTDRL